MSETPVPEKTLEDHFRKYAWDYFAPHADHRLRAFHFCILLSTAIIGGFGLLVRNGELQQWMSAFGFLLLFFSFVFWKMDGRTRQLVKTGEAALMYLDAQHNLKDHDGLPNPLCLFHREAAVSVQLKLFPLFTGHFNWARSFRWVFGMFSIVGVGMAIASFTSSAV